MNEGEKPFIGDEGLRQDQEILQKHRQLTEQVQAAAAYVLDFAKKDIVWTDKMIASTESQIESHKAYAEKWRKEDDPDILKILDETEESLQARTDELFGYLQSWQDWKANLENWIHEYGKDYGENTLDLIDLNKELEELAEIQENIKDRIVEDRPGQDN